MRHPRFALLLAAWAGIFALSACGSGDDPLGVVDPEAVPANPTYEQVYGIVQRECTPCHGDGGADPSYEDCEDLLENVDGLVTEALDRNTMPPGAWPRLNSEERLIISRWVSQGADAPCED
jgi:uncharacterized membrane protein